MYLITARIEPALPDLTATQVRGLLAGHVGGVEHVYVETTGAASLVAVYVAGLGSTGLPASVSAVERSLQAVAGPDRHVATAADGLDPLRHLMNGD
jgi:hypothetical protein